MSAATGNMQQQPSAPWLAWGLAVVLALGGCFWGVLVSLVFLRAEVSPLAVAVFGSGYLVTVGYIVRSISTPPPGVRVVIWMSSLLVQGAWLLWLMRAVIEKVLAGGSAAGDIGNIFTAWWVFATVASVAGLLADLPKGAEPDATTDGGHSLGSS